MIFHGLTNRTGSSLVELVVALAVLGIAAAGLAMVGSMSATGNVTSHDRIAATALAIDKMEELSDLPFDDLTAGTSSDGPLDPDGGPDGLFTRTWTVADTTIGANPGKTITVTVTWPEDQSVGVSTQRVRSTLVTNAFVTAFPVVGTRGWSQVR